jgi:conjugative relaxase-like TrwC/TraI family protein
MSIHKLTAGDGYAYLTRQVAALDATDRQHTGLADYYSQRGETPGRWTGSALADVNMTVGQEVTADQMASLFAEGRHPNVDQITADLIKTGASAKDKTAATELGKPFPRPEDTPAFQIAVARRVAEVNAANGARSNTILAAAERAQIRTQVGREMFAEKYGRAPKDPRELSSFIARNSRSTTSAIAGFDLTFTPVKSVSALWAIAPRHVAEQITAAHHAAVDDVLGWLEREAAYTRGGKAGVQQLDTTGLLAAAFDHRDSRAGDPDLHTHVAVSSKVRVVGSDGTAGRWLALDARVLFKATVTASERYNTRIEAELHRRLGLTFVPRSDADAAATAGKRLVREVAGVPQELVEVWSKRRARIDVRRATLAAAFQAEHGRPPTPVEALKLAQQATLETRDAKHEPRSEAQQRATWRAEAADLLGSPDRVDRLVRDAVPRPPLRRKAARRAAREAGTAAVSEELLGALAHRTRKVIEGGRSTWQVWHVRSEAERQLRAQVPAPLMADSRLLDDMVDQVVTRVLHPSQSVRLTRPDPVHASMGSPRKLSRRDGASVYDVAGSQLYTSATVLADEMFLVEAAHRRDGRVVTDRDVDLALLESVANGLNLNTAQAHLVRQMATSGARVQLAIAPAGSGKTTAMSALTAAWTHSGGTVLGLAPSAVAAGVLREEIGTHADTLAKLVYHLDHLALGPLPAWAQAVDDKTLIVVDEAGMAATGDLATVTRFALDRCASVRLVGDDRQLAAVGAGGVLRDIQASVGAVTLTELVRFRDQAEAAAGLAIRTGDTTGLGFYIDNDRVHVGDLTTVTNQAYEAWTTDQAAGLDSIMLAPTRELATELNIRARTDRLAACDDDSLHSSAAEAPAPAQIDLVDGSAASAGDTIISRRNDRSLRTTATDFVKNGDRWTVTTAHTTGDLKGALDVVHIHTGRHLRLPADYVDKHVQLGYATTVHSAQGVTADTSHTVTAGAESRQQLYVALTRGRDANHLYLNAAMDGDEHSIITPAATHPQTALNILEQILARDEAQPSATSTARRTHNPATALTQATARYADSLHTAAADLLGADRMAALEAHAEALAPGILDSPAWPTLRGHLALLAAEGHHPETALTAALREREIDTAADVAAVLDWRLDPTPTRTTDDPDNPPPATWLPGIPARLRHHSEWGRHLRARHDLVEQATAQVRRQAEELTATTAPAWARQLLNPQHGQLLVDLTVFRAAHGVAEEDTRPTGPRQQAAADRRAQVDLNKRVNAVLDSSYRTAWTPLAEQVGLTPGADPHWPVLAENLAALSRAGADAPTLLRRAAAEAQLPDEYQAAALWWRIARHVAPAVLTPDPSAGPPDPLRPVWLAQLAAVLDVNDRTGTTTALMQDPRWPAVITAITRASAHGIPYTDLFRHPIGPDGEPVPGHALADALIYRATVLTDPAPYDPDKPASPDDQAGHHHGADDAPAPYPEDPYDADTAPPEDLHMATTLHTGTGPGGPPDNAAEPPLDHSTAGTGFINPLPPLQDETIPAEQAALNDAELDEELFWAATRRSGFEWEPTEQQQERALARAADAEFASVSPERIAALNDQAAAFYEHAYRGSWAQTYLTDRLGGIDLTGDPRTRPGYAPKTWTALTTHLRRHGATDEELLAAGLTKQASTGRLIDAFRDRLILPIHTTAPGPGTDDHGSDGPPPLQIVGFVGRRNPTHDHLQTGMAETVQAGPKYLNTSETVLFTKGDQLYGLAEHADRLAAGATPVIAEGPLDALAVSLASPNHVGVAPLGTALTDAQADSLIPYLHLAGESGGSVAPVVATDADLAGKLAAERDYWILTARGADPSHLAFPAGHDPASLLRRDGRAALASRLTAATTPLSEVLVDERLSHLPPGDALPAAAAVIAAGPADQWAARTRDMSRRLHTPIGVALTELVRTINRWDGDRHAASDQQIHSVQQVRDRITGQNQLTPMHRWAPLMRQIDSRLVRDDSWAPLAAAVDQAHRAGHDVSADLTRVLAQGPLDGDDPGTDLKWRLLADLEPEPTDWHASRRAQAFPVGSSAPRRSVPPPNPGHTPGHSRSPER